jgi:hypothetical protein
MYAGGDQGNRDRFLAYKTRKNLGRNDEENILAYDSCLINDPGCVFR